MKKIFAMALALCLPCGMTALADNTTINQDSTSKTADTTVSYTIAENETYTVTIPSSVTLTGSDNLSGMISIGLKTEKFNVPGKTIAVKLTSAENDFKLVNGEKKIPYTLKAAGVEYKADDTVLEWTYGNATDQTKALVVSAIVSSNLPAGEYTDTLTFTVSVTGNSAGIGGVTVEGWGDGGTISGEATEVE